MPSLGKEEGGEAAKRCSVPPTENLQVVSNGREATAGPSAPDRDRHRLVGRPNERCNTDLSIETSFLPSAKEEGNSAPFGATIIVDSREEEEKMVVVMRVIPEEERHVANFHSSPTDGGAPRQSRQRRHRALGCNLRRTWH